MFPLVPDPTAPPPVAAIPPAPPSPFAVSEPLSDPAPTPAGLTTTAGSPTTAGNGRPAGPDAALAALIAGNRRFVSGQTIFGHQVRRAVAVATEPRPHAVVVGCMDSRVPVEAVFDQDFGSVFAVRSAGHVLDGVGLGSVEIAVRTVGVPLVVVLGHRRCAAVATAVDAWRSGRRPRGSAGHVVDEITDAIRETEPDRVGAVDPVARRHTELTVARLRNALGDSARVVGAYYDVDTGAVELTG